MRGCAQQWARVGAALRSLQDLPGAVQLGGEEIAAGDGDLRGAGTHGGGRGQHGHGGPGRRRPAHRLVPVPHRPRREEVPEQRQRRQVARLVCGTGGEHGPGEARQPAAGRGVQAPRRRPRLDVPGESGERVPVRIRRREHRLGVAHRAERDRRRIAQLGAAGDRLGGGEGPGRHGDQVHPEAVEPPAQAGHPGARHLMQVPGLREGSHQP